MTAENPTNSPVFQIDQLLEEASKLAKTERDSGRFFKTLLQRAVLAVDAQAAAIWMLGSQSHPIAIAEHQLSQLGPRADETQAAIDQTIIKCVETGQAKRLGANSKSSAMTVLCCPYQSASGATDSVVALYFVKRIDPELASLYASFLEAVAEIAADFGRRQSSPNPSLKNRSTSETLGTSSDWKQFKSLSDALHENLDVRSTAISLVNHGRKFYSCDRVLLAQKSGRRFNVIAASGAATVNRKSETISAIQLLVAKAFRHNDKPIIFHNTNTPPPRLVTALARYQSVSGHKFLMLSPLKDKRGRVKFVQVIGSAEENDVARILKQVAVAEPQAKSALNNAAQYQSIPLRGFLGTLGGSQLGTGLRKLLFPLSLVTLLGLVIGALCLLRTDLIVTADGSIAAETEKNVFAAKDGVVARLHVAHGDQVQSDQLLIEMTSNQFDSDLRTIRGNIQTESKRLEAIEAVKSSLDRGAREGQRELGRLSSQEIESKQQIKNLNLELTELQREQERLQIRSPIAGTIVTRDAKTKLLDRPVRRGDVLLQLIDDHGKWLAKIRVPDSRIAHLMKLKSDRDIDDRDQNQWQEAVPVSLSVAAFPERKFEGVIRSISNTAEVVEETGQAFIVITVEIKHDEDITFQPGSSVRAEVNCGQTSLGYAWFNEFIDSVGYRFF